MSKTKSNINRSNYNVLCLNIFGNHTQTSMHETETILYGGAIELKFNEIHDKKNNKVLSECRARLCGVQVHDVTALASDVVPYKLHFNILKSDNIF